MAKVTKKKKGGKKTNKERTSQTEPTAVRLPGGRQVKIKITGTGPGKAGSVYAWWEICQGRRCLERAHRPRCHKYDPRKESWDQCIRLMVAVGTDAFYEEYHDAGEGKTDDTVVGVDGKYTFMAALHSMRDGEVEILRSPTWRSSGTWKKHKGEIKRICAELDKLEDINPDTLATMRDQMIEKAAASKNSKGRQKAKETINEMMVAMSYSIRALREFVNEREGREVLPEVPLSDIITVGTRYQFEQVKWIPAPVLTRLVELMFNMIGNGLVMGIALMLCLGLRTNEACAALFGELELIDGHMVRYKVRTQGPDRSRILKSQNAYRYVFFGKLLYDMVVARRDHLRVQGYSDEAIARMHVVSRPEDPTVSSGPEVLSSVARELLLQSGYTEEDLRAATRLMQIQPDYEADGRVMLSVSAYVFRRNYATAICNICDLAPGSGIEDYLLGHELKTPLPFDVKDLGVQKSLVDKMDRWVLHPDHTSHPLFQAVEIGFGDVIDLNTHAGYTFVAEDDIEVELTLETTEPNGTIYIRTNAALPKRGIHREIGTEDTPDRRIYRQIVLMPPLPEEFEQYLGERNVDRLSAEKKVEEDG